MKRCLALLVSSMLWTTSAFAELAFDDNLISATAGVFCEIPSVRSEEAPGTDVGQIDILEQTPEFRWDTMQVPAHLGISFGVKTQTVTDVPLDNVVIRIKHPPFLETATTEQVYVSSIGENSFNAYTFDLPREMVPGNWILTAEWNDQILYKANFVVVPANMAPHIAGMCGGGLLS